MVDEGIVTVQGEDSQDCAANGKRSAESMSTNQADEALYRWFPPVVGDNTNSSSSSKSATSLDTTFETLHRDLANRWSSSSSSSYPSAPGSAAAPCLADTNGRSSNTANNGGTHESTNSRKSKCGEVVSSPPGRPTATGQACTTDAPEVPSDGEGAGATAASQLLFLVRHGETDMNAAGKLQGRGVNAHLNDIGQEQAEDLGRFVRNVPFDGVTSSSLHRAHETAMRVAELNVRCVERAQENGEPPMDREMSPSVKEKSTPADFCCGDRAQVRVRKSEGLDELSWGVLEGQDSALEPWKSKLAALKASWDTGHFDKAAEGGENLLEVEARARAAVEACLDRGKGLNLVVSHGRTLRILMLSLTGLGLDQMTNMGKVPNAGLYIVEAWRSAPGAPRSYRLLKSQH